MAGFFLHFNATQALAQTEDASDVFLKAYMTAQQGEKLEHENQFKAALAKYRFAGSLIEELRKSHAEWQPAIVEYRGRKISESILRLQEKLSTQGDLAGTESAPPPPQSVESRPTTQVATPRAPEPAPAPAANDTAIKEATKDLNDRIDRLQSDLDKSRTLLTAAQKERENLDDRLKDTNSKLETAQGDLEKTKGAERQVRDELSKVQESLKKAQTAGEGNNKPPDTLKAEVTKLKEALIAAESARAAAEKERDASSAKTTEANKQATEATKQLAGVKEERDQAIARLKGMGAAQQRVEVLIAENSDLKKKLADAENTVRELSEDKPKKEKELAEVKKQIDQLRQQLASSQKQNKDYEVQIVALRGQLDDTAAQLEKAKLVGATAEETTRLRKENDMLRNIVMRERQEEARREQAKKLMLAEFDKLKVKSDTLNEQIELLAQPVTKLSDEELALLRTPVVSLSDNNPATMKASFAFAKKTTANSVGIAGHDDDSEDDHMAEGAVATSQDGSRPDVPDELVNVARTAKRNFEQGKYRSAEKQYQEILTKAPNNLYSLSNLGVVYFRTGRFKAAELTLKKAVVVSPRDEFAHTTLGIVYYRQSKFDAALTELTKSLAINPKSATAHNYLGITASQKGWQEAAEKEILEAIANNGNYADAHFNLAVIYATAEPPARELARQHYAKATELGAPRDPGLEKLIH